MPIPGIRVLDEILAGLPTNSAQRIEIGKLKEQIAALEKENGELKERLSRYAPKTGLSAESLKILQYLFTQPSEMFIAEELSGVFGLQTAVVKYHCDKLKKQGHVSDGWRPMPGGTYESEFKITEDGIAYLVEKGLTV